MARNMPKGCGNKMPLHNFSNSLALAYRLQFKKNGSPGRARSHRHVHLQSTSLNCKKDGGLLEKMQLHMHKKLFS